jgi:pentatricopeptide repeat protein
LYNNTLRLPRLHPVSPHFANFSAKYPQFLPLLSAEIQEDGVRVISCPLIFTFTFSLQFSISISNPHCFLVEVSALSAAPSPQKPRQPHRKMSKPDAISNQESLRRFDQLLAARNPPSSILQFNQLFSSLSGNKTSSNTLFSLFIRLAQAEGIGPGDCTYGILMEHCVRMNKVRLLFGFWGQFLKEGRRANTLIFSPMLKCLCQEDGILEAATIMLDKMPKLGCVPDVFSYNILIDGLCEKGEIKKAMNFLNDMISNGHPPNVVTYSILINRLCKKGEIEKAVNILNDMISKGLQTNIVTYNTLVDGLCKKSEVQKAMNFLDDMISQGHQPDVITYSALLNGLCKKGETEKAAELMDVMISKGHQPNEVTYTTIVDGLCKKDEIEKAMNYVNDIISKGYQPDIVTHNILLNVLCKNEKATDLLNDIISKGHQPDVITYNTLVDGLCKKGEIDNYEYSR